jgi:hypothetical protein
MIHTTLRGWPLQWRRIVFTARYELNLYIQRRHILYLTQLASVTSLSTKLRRAGDTSCVCSYTYFTFNTTERICTKFRINCLYQMISRSTFGSVSMKRNTALLRGVQISRLSVNPPPPNSSLCLRIQLLQRKYKSSQLAIRKQLTI